MIVIAVAALMLGGQANARADPVKTVDTAQDFLGSAILGASFNWETNDDTTRVRRLSVESVERFTNMHGDENPGKYCVTTLIGRDRQSKVTVIEDGQEVSPMRRVPLAWYKVFDVEAVGKNVYITKVNGYGPTNAPPWLEFSTEKLAKRVEAAAKFLISECSPETAF